MIPGSGSASTSKSSKPRASGDDPAWQDGYDYGGT